MDGADVRRRRVDPVAVLLLALVALVIAAVTWWVWPRPLQNALPGPTPSAATPTAPEPVLTPALPTPTVSGALGNPGTPTPAPGPASRSATTASTRASATASGTTAASPSGGAVPASPTTTRTPVAQPTHANANPVVVDADWLATTSAKAGLTREAMRAYAAAELRLTVEKPGCHVSWNTLAGLGWVESRNGTLGGHWVQADGTLDSPIIGPALDGVRFAQIRDTDRGEYDGDTVWDRAVGPMQFLPTTWDAWGRDGSGDGVADPQNLDDAALAAASYLCVNGRDLTTPAGWTNAVFSYNHSEDYVTTVLTAAEVYAERSWK